MLSYEDARAVTAAAPAEEFVLSTSTGATDDLVYLRQWVLDHVAPIYGVDESVNASVPIAPARSSSPSPPHIVRVSGDSPVLDPAIVSRAIGFYSELQPDLATNVQER